MGMKWLMLNKWNRLFHSSRVKFPLVNTLASWCLVSMWRILIFGVHINPVKQPTQNNSVGPWNMPHCGTSTFENHFDYCITVLKDIQHSAGTRMRCTLWNVINVCWNDVGVLDWDGVMHVWLDNCRRVSPWLSLGSMCSVRCAMKHSNNKVPKIKSWNTVHAQPCMERNDFTSCGTVWNSSLFLAHPTSWCKRVTSENTQNTWCWFRVFKVLCKIRVLKQSKCCCVVFPTWQCCQCSLVWWMWEIKRAKLLSDCVHFVTARASLTTAHKIPSPPTRGQIQAI